MNKPSASILSQIPKLSIKADPDTFADNAPNRPNAKEVKKPKQVEPKPKKVEAEEPVIMINKSIKVDKIRATAIELYKADCVKKGGKVPNFTQIVIELLDKKIKPFMGDAEKIVGRE